MPWLCTAIAVAVLILGTTCVVIQCQPSSIPKSIAFRLVVGVLTIFGIGMIVDWFSYNVPDDWLASVGEWIGFAIILSTVFTLPYVGRSIPNS